MARQSYLVTALWLIAVLGSLIWNMHHVNVLMFGAARQRADAAWTAYHSYWEAIHTAGVYEGLPDVRSGLHLKSLNDPSSVRESRINVKLASTAALDRRVREKIAENSLFVVDRNTLDSDVSELLVLPKGTLQEGKPTGQPAVSRVRLQGLPYLKLTRPIVLGQNCTLCHSGRQVGEVVGNISVSVPLDGLLAASTGARARIGTTHLLVGLVGCALIVGLLWCQRRREAILDRARREYTELSENLPMGCFRLEPDGGFRIVVANTPMARMFGFESRGALAGTDFIDLFAQADDQRNFVGLLANSEDRAVAEMRMRRQDGSDFWASLAVRITRDVQSEAVWLDGLIEDVTDRRQREQQLRKLSTAVEQNPSVVVITDVDGHIEYANPKFTTQTGYSMAEVLGKTPRILKSGRMSPEIYTQLWRTIKAGQVWRGELLNRKKNGELYWESTTISPIVDESGKITNFVALKEDITVRKRTESKMAELNRRLIEVSRQAGMAEVATDVLHNVGNVLTSVNVSSQLVIEKLQRYPLDDLRRLANLMHEHSENLADFLNEDNRAEHVVKFMEELARVMETEQRAMLEELESLLTNVHHISQIISRQQSHAKTIAVEERATLQEVMEQALMINAASFQRHSISVTRDWDELPEVVIDRHRLLQILVNLLSNAKKAVEENERGGRNIVLRLRRKNKNRVVIEVEDNGKGIEPENLTKIFSHGFTTRTDGRGFGLHSAALNAKQLGGSLSAHSDGLGRGARFTLELPFRPAVDISADNALGASPLHLTLASQTQTDAGA
ncbi:MAG: PAS domain S-box protein [Planctomycetes bacterium]|nr:PAS domain S-box protein [Planctomycetota bacterium]